MKSTRNNDATKELHKLNQLKDTVRQNLEKYNKLVRSVWEIVHALAEHQEKSNHTHSIEARNHEKKIIKNLEAKLTLSKNNIKTNENKNLENEIAEGMNQIEKLEKKLYGKADRQSPSFLIKREA